jgi:translation initiation factor eIF-2B subunit delta
MKDQNVTRVLLGASSLLSNGAMLGPAGTAMVAALAKAQHIPVIVAAESYKFSEKVQLDSIVYNELGQTSEIAVMALGGGAEGAEGDAANVPGPVAQRQTGYRGSAPPLSASGAEQQSTGDTDAIALPAAWRGGDSSNCTAPLPFNVVNLRYDLTPIGNISVVATETGLTPATSIPVLMREMVQTDMFQPAGRPGAPSRPAPAPAAVGAAPQQGVAAGGLPPPPVLQGGPVAMAVP